MKKSKTYFNTTSQSLEYAEQRVAKNKTQEEIVLGIFEEYKKLSASQVLSLYPKNIPLTSIRRAISNLKFDYKLEKLAETRKGIYNAPEHLFRISEYQTTLL